MVGVMLNSRITYRSFLPLLLSVLVEDEEAIMFWSRSLNLPRRQKRNETMIQFLPQAAFSLPLSLLVLISLFGFMIPSRCQEVRLCPESNNNHTTNSSHLDSDLNFLLGSLSAQASSHTFYNESSNGIYGLFLCRVDISSEDCHSCVGDAGKRIKVDCPSRTNAAIWLDKCMLRYSVNNFFGIRETNPTMVPYGNDEYHDSIDLGLVNDLINDAADANLMFKDAKLDPPEGEGNQRFGLAQCTRDIIKRDCEVCLKSLVSSAEGCCKQKREWRASAPSCDLRVGPHRFLGTPAAPPSSSPAPLPPPHKKGWSRTKIIVISISAVAAAAILLGLLYRSLLWRNKRHERDKSEELPLRNRMDQQLVYSMRKHLDVKNQDSNGDIHYFSFSTLKNATDNFSDANKLGEGGFGPVYKGKLMGGEEVAVKRLSTKSSQGHEKFKNEAKVIWKLQHKNLVRLLGCCVEGEKKLLVYEFMANTSLDAFLFDPLKCKQLDWLKRENIVTGIARGILYLHEDSRLKIIHRDLKASNILLDEDMNPKISDFGTARIFGSKQMDANTNRIVGTYGYMAPEYAMEGLFSVKSDVYSFGVLILEVISGRKNIGFLNMDRAQNLLSYAWELWSEGRAEEMVDMNLAGDCPVSEAVKWIHIGLLCVQEDPNIRPTMSMVVLMLGSQSINLPQPSKPLFLSGGGALITYQYSTTKTGTKFLTTTQSSTSASI